MAQSYRNVNSTSLSLLNLVKEDDPQAWQRLNYLYGPLIYHWCRRSGLQNDDAADIVQDVLKSVTVNINSFRYDRENDSFRGWLWTITINAIRSQVRIKKRNPVAIGGSGAVNLLNNIPQEEPPDYDEETEPGQMTGLISRCIKLVERDFEKTTWRAFQLTTFESQTAVAAAQELGIKSNAVRQAKSRVLRRIREEFVGLIDHNF